MTDQELEWRFIRARLTGHRMYLKEELQNAIITQQLVINFYLYSRFQELHV